MQAAIALLTAKVAHLSSLSPGLAALPPIESAEALQRRLQTEQQQAVRCADADRRIEQATKNLAQAGNDEQAAARTLDGLRAALRAETDEAAERQLQRSRSVAAARRDSAEALRHLAEQGGGLGIEALTARAAETTAEADAARIAAIDASHQTPPAADRGRPRRQHRRRRRAGSGRHRPGRRRGRATPRSRPGHAVPHRRGSADPARHPRPAAGRARPPGRRRRPAAAGAHRRRVPHHHRRRPGRRADRGNQGRPDHGRTRSGRPDPQIARTSSAKAPATSFSSRCASPRWRTMRRPRRRCRSSPTTSCRPSTIPAPPRRCGRCWNSATTCR